MDECVLLLLRVGFDHRLQPNTCVANVANRYSGSLRPARMSSCTAAKRTAALQPVLSFCTLITTRQYPPQFIHFSPGAMPSCSACNSRASICSAVFHSTIPGDPTTVLPPRRYCAQDMQTQGCVDETAGEAQSCADIAAERVRALEEQLSGALADLAASKEAADASLQQARQEAAEQLESARQEAQTKLEAASAALAAAQAAAETEKAEASARCSSLLRALQEAEAQKAELEAQVARAAASLKAADDLKEARCGPSVSMCVALRSVKQMSCERGVHGGRGTRRATLLF